MARDSRISHTAHRSYTNMRCNVDVYYFVYAILYMENWGFCLAFVLWEYTESRWCWASIGFEMFDFDFAGFHTNIYSTLNDNTIKGNHRCLFLIYIVCTLSFCWINSMRFCLFSSYPLHAMAKGNFRFRFQWLDDSK